MEEKCIHHNINMEFSKLKENAYHIDVNTFNNNQKNKIYNINNDRKLELTKTYYAITDIKSQCNNITEQWQKWFTISYYYLGNRDGRYNEMAKNTITYDIPNGCNNACKDDYIINITNKCENKKTFEYGKYKNFLPHDPLAIICIIGSHFKKDLIHKKNYKGNYYYTLDNLLYDGINIDTVIDSDKKEKDNLIIKNKFVNITPEIRKKLLAKIDSDVNSKPIKTITDDVSTAYNRLKNYIDFIVKDNEQDSKKIVNIINKDIGAFYNLFDKRDELYIKYLNDFNSEKKKYNLLYTHTLISDDNCEEIRNKINIDNYDNKKYLKYLFNYCRKVCFSKNSIFAERLQLYGIYDTINNKDDKIDVLLTIEMNDKEEDLKSNQVGTQDNDKNTDNNIYKIMPVKLETEPINIFDEYTYIFKLYKSFLIVYPTVFTIILSVLFATLILYIINIITDHKISQIINRVYAYILYWILLFTYIFVLNPLFVWIIRMLKWFLYDGDYFTGALNKLIEKFTDFTGTYKSLGKNFGYTLTFIIILVLLIYIFVTMTIDEILMIIPNILIYILYFLYSIIIYLLKLLIYILITFKPVNIIAICFFIYLIIVYYYILYSFDYEKILNSFNGKVDESIGKEHANGDYSIIHTYYNIKGCKIIWNRVELIKYWYLLGRYTDAYNILNKIKIPTE